MSLCLLRYDFQLRLGGSSSTPAHRQAQHVHGCGLEVGCRGRRSWQGSGKGLQPTMCCCLLDEDLTGNCCQQQRLSHTLHAASSDDPDGLGVAMECCSAASADAPSGSPVLDANAVEPRHRRRLRRNACDFPATRSNFVDFTSACEFGAMKTANSEIVERIWGLGLRGGPRRLTATAMSDGWVGIRVTCTKTAVQQPSYTSKCPWQAERGCCCLW